MDIMTRRTTYKTFTVLFIALCIIFQSCRTASNKQSWSQLPYDRRLMPAGTIITMGDSAKECHALDCSISPDKKFLVIQERYSIVFLSTATHQITYSLPLDSIAGIKGAMCAFSGICWYHKNNDDYVFFSAAMKKTDSYVILLKWNGKEATLSRIYKYNAVKPSDFALPNSLLISTEEGHDYLEVHDYMYVVLNGNNQLLKQDIATGDTIWIKNTGIAPYGIARAQNKLYVTNWAGRIPGKDEINVAGAPWEPARIDPATAACNEGSVSVFDPKNGMLLKEIVVGLHPNSIIASPDGNYIYLTNSNSDIVSVINAKTDLVSENISTTLEGEFNHYFGDSPNGLAITADGKTLYVANGMDNALAVISLGKSAQDNGTKEQSTIEGFIPTAAYPSSVSILKDKKLYITNLESFGANLAFKNMSSIASAYNSHHMLASISVVNVPSKTSLKEYTKTVIAANQLERLKSAQLPPRPGVDARPVPERIGEPSVFKHVLYIIRENRTYDQVLGDVRKGDGDTSLCIFGEQVTPNIHRLVDEFTLMDHFYDSGKCSAEGHPWADASIVTDYLEKDVRSWFRSYPHTLDDALAYAPTGFIWDNARRHGLNVRIYGEAITPEFDNTLTWTDIYNGFLKNEPFKFTNQSTLNTVRELLSPNYPGYDGHKIPDILRADAFIKELEKYESMQGDSLPQLMVMALPSDHTAGTKPGYPTPRAMVADNDLALGQIIDALSHSRFWKNTVVFSVEDDSQAGWDHVSAYRTVAMVMSPYSRMTETVHTSYNQPSIVRTIEQILGLPPMNIQDAIAAPMTACFTDTPDFTPYTAVKNITALDEMNASLSTLTGQQLYYARLSLEPQFDGIDTGDDDLFNHIIWYACNRNTPYPSKYKGKDTDD